MTLGMSAMQLSTYKEPEHTLIEVVDGKVGIKEAIPDDSTSLRQRHEKKD